MSDLEFPRATWKSSFPESHCSSTLVPRVLQKAGTPESQKKLDCLHFPLTLIILGPVQVSVHMEEDEPKNEIAPASTSDKEVGKNESSGK